MKQQTIDGLREFLAGGGHPTRQTGVHYFMSLTEAAEVLALVEEVEQSEQAKTQLKEILCLEMESDIVPAVECLRAELAAERERAALICEGLRIYTIPGFPASTLLKFAAARIRDGQSGASDAER